MLLSYTYLEQEFNKHKLLCRFSLWVYSYTFDPRPIDGYFCTDGQDLKMNLNWVREKCNLSSESLRLIVVEEHLQLSLFDFLLTLVIRASRLHTFTGKYLEPHEIDKTKGIQIKSKQVMNILVLLF